MLNALSYIIIYDMNKLHDNPHCDKTKLNEYNDYYDINIL